MLGGMRFRWVTIFLDFPNNAFAPGVAFWREVTESGLSPPRGDSGEFATLLPATGDAYLRVQRVGEGRGCHLDLHVDVRSESLPAAASRAKAAGATVRHAEDGLVVADSPGGFTFCLVEWEGESAVPSPVRFGAAGASRADQLCLDIPASDFDRECSFWAALTGISPRTGSLPEFTVLPRPAGIPVRLLLQRRSDAAPGDRVTGHVDFACADRQRLADVHTGAGARVLATFAHWIVLADPVGREYCLTGRDPRTGIRPALPGAVPSVVLFGAVARQLLKVPGVPFPLAPSSAALWQVDEATGAVMVSAQPHTDIFIDPGNDSASADTNAALNAESLLNAATLLGDVPEGDFQFSARVTVGFASTFDAGVLLLWLDERRWGKLCFEFSPAGEPMVVSVVCRGVSDDANAFVVPGRSVWLRISRIDRAYAYHAALDGKTWQMVRVFVLDDQTSRDRIGFEGQSPTGDGCSVTFDQIRFVPERLADLRDGS